jgi:hypothetical protein
VGTVLRKCRRGSTATRPPRKVRQKPDHKQKRQDRIHGSARSQTAAT